MTKPKQKWRQKRIVLTVLAIPKHRVLRGRLVLHYKTKEFGWLSSPKFHAMIRKHAEVKYA